MQTKKFPAINKKTIRQQPEEMVVNEDTIRSSSLQRAMIPITSFLVAIWEVCIVYIYIHYVYDAS